MLVLNALYTFPGRLSQVLAVVSGLLTALSDGMQYGWTSPMTSVLLAPTSPIDASEKDIVFLELIYMVGGICGIPLTIYMLDKVGRKNTMLISAAESLIAWIMIGTSTSLALLYVARFIAGFAADVNFVTAPVYIAEISDKHIRGRLGSIIYIMMMMGILLIYCIGPYVSIAASSLVGVGILTVQLFTFSFMPETPYYYLIKHQKEEARKSLQMFRTTNNVDEELDEIEEIVQKENLERGKISDLFTVKSNLKAVLIMTVLNTAQHFSGITVMFMNLHMILEDAASILSANAAAITFSSVMLVSCTVAGCIIDKLGRKILLYTSSFLTGISLLILAVYFTVKIQGVNISTFNWVPIFAVMLYALTYKYGLGLVPIVLTAEIFPTNVKAYGVTYADLIYVVAGMISVVIFHVLQSNFGMDVPFYLFGCCCMLTCLYSILVIPETKGKTLYEIQNILKGKNAIKLDVVSNNHSNEKSQSFALSSSIDNALNYGTNKY
ncbi:hypothetical protein RN001_012221 [Aquatica leii]|uniref:Major facilitator superfamily (MFS) profile domain-containing protein n=1 Tax=Aquatica leii TaxID=1421715 RepID=A0AAN7P2P9_9COLE|nr:hypothetical protein RN001_012221 [Aquatica leii]